MHTFLRTINITCVSRVCFGPADIKIHSDITSILKVGQSILIMIVLVGKLQNIVDLHFKTRVTITDIHKRSQNLRHLEPGIGAEFGGIRVFPRDQNNRGSSRVYVT